ncbi:MAG: hypothetical protein ACR2PU_03940 [Gammaproteobacteria bacterium]
MKAKALLTAVLLAATNFAWANGGVSLDNAIANGYVSTDNDRPEVVVQGPIDQFDVEVRSNDQFIVDTDELKQSYDGQS